jgi:hypothetical protein
MTEPPTPRGILGIVCSPDGSVVAAVTLGVHPRQHSPVRRKSVLYVSLVSLFFMLDLGCFVHRV